MDYCHEHPVYIQPKVCKYFSTIIDLATLLCPPKYVGGPPIASVIISGKTHIEVQIDHNPEVGSS